MIHVINLGMVNTYLIQGEKNVLVDTGTQKTAKKLLEAITKILDPMSIDFIVLTHGHSDHIGGLDFIRKHTNAKVIMHQVEYETLIGKTAADIKPLVLLTKVMFLIPFKEKPIDIDVDILITDTYDFTPYGIDAQLIHTPGHTKGSISLLFKNNAIIGDQMMAMMPWSKPNKPILAYNIDLVKVSMEELMTLGADTFYFSHGKSYNIEQVRKGLSKM